MTRTRSWKLIVPLRTVAYRRVVPLRRFATEQFVFDDQIGHVTIVGNEMPNIPYPVGAELAVRLRETVRRLSNAWEEHHETARPA